MKTGQVISAAGHAALIGWMVFGGIFRTEQLPIEATEVSVISGEAFAALMAAQDSPTSQSEITQPAQPVVDNETGAVPEPETVPEQEIPEPAPAPAADDAPDVSELSPLPNAEVLVATPVLPTPEPDVAVEAPESNETPVPQASIRVAPEPVIAPDPEARPDLVEQEAVQQMVTGGTVAEPKEATAAEEAASEIVTEAEKPSAAPETSLRPPPLRPTRSAVQAAETSELAAETQNQLWNQQLKNQIHRLQLMTHSPKPWAKIRRHHLRQEGRRCLQVKRMHCAWLCSNAGTLVRFLAWPWKQP